MIKTFKILERKEAEREQKKIRKKQYNKNTRKH